MHSLHYYIDSLHTLHRLHTIHSLHYTIDSLYTRHSLHNIYMLHTMYSHSLHIIHSLHTMQSHSLYTIHSQHTILRLHNIHALHTIHSLHTIYILHTKNRLHTIDTKLHKHTKDGWTRFTHKATYIWLKSTRTGIPIGWMSPKRLHSRSSHAVIFYQNCTEFLRLVRNGYGTDNFK